jgi:pyruvate,water dikinase
MVGCVNATMQLRTGDRVRVDGGRGTVEVLARAGDAPAITSAWRRVSETNGRGSAY